MIPSTLLLAESYLYRLDPVALPVSPSWGIRWYGLSYAAGVLLAWLLIRWMARTRRTIVPERGVGDLIVYAVVGILVGGRLGYAAFYDPSLFWRFTASPPWWELLAFWTGGMASHGGIVGVVVAMLIFAHRHRLPGLHLFDLMAIAAPPGLMLGRLANFVNGELWGKPLGTGMQATPPWWSVKYPEEVYSGTIDLSVVRDHVGGEATFHDSVVVALRNNDPTVVAEVVPQLTAHWPSQLLQAMVEGPMLFLVLIIVWWSPRRPGVVSGAFLLTYGIFRILTETVRQPDEGVAIVMGLQRGQLLSVAMVVFGLVMVVICAKRPVRRLGGLGAPERSGD